MFVQVVRAKAADAEGIERIWNENRDRSPEGFLGATGGITTKGEMIVAARFESRELAMKMSDSPEQSAEWQAIEKCLAGPAEFVESEDVETVMPGTNDAGFVQMMRCAVSDRARYEQIEKQIGAKMAELRPDVIGHLNIWLPDGRIHIVDWFTSEAEARAAEKKEFPAEMKALFEEWQSLCSAVEWFDLPKPLYS